MKHSDLVFLLQCKKWHAENVTPQEQYWLDRYAKVSEGRSGLIFHERGEDGQLVWPIIILKSRGHGPFGTIPINLAWIKSEVLTLERKARYEAKKEIENRVGAFI